MSQRCSSQYMLSIEQLEEGIMNGEYFVAEI